jgi:hypothetical protein
LYRVPTASPPMGVIFPDYKTGGNAAVLFRRQQFPSDENPDGHQKALKTVWHATLRRAKVRYFRIYDLRSTYATRLSAGGVADEWVIQLLRQGDAKVFKKYSQMKLQMKREALEKLNRHANEAGPGFGTVKVNRWGFGTVLAQFWHSSARFRVFGHRLCS